MLVPRGVGGGAGRHETEMQFHAALRDAGGSGQQDVEALVLSHGHFDHFMDCIPLAKRTGATVVSTFELVNYCSKNGVENVHGMNIGGAHRFPFGRLKLTPAPTKDTNFLDISIDIGIFYTYEVTAVDTSGNESPATPKSEPVTVPKTP